jgi:hypothetical protein
MVADLKSGFSDLDPDIVQIWISKPDFIRISDYNPVLVLIEFESIADLIKLLTS